MFLNIKSENTAPVKTLLVEPVVAGANLATVSTFSTKIVEEFAINTDMKNLVRYFMTKSAQGIISLHVMVPYQRLSLRRNAEGTKPSVQRTTMFVAINCNKNEYDSEDNNVHVISESNLAMSELSFNSNKTFNGVMVGGSPIENYIPYNAEAWFMKHGDTTIGEMANNLTLSTFFEIKKLIASTQDEESEVDAEEVHGKVKNLWERYLKSEQSLVDKNILVLSDLLYADSNSLVPITTVFQNTISDTNFALDSRRVFGSKEAGASYAPNISFIFASGVITAKEVDEVSGYRYGQYAVTSKRDEVVTVLAEAKATTLETTTREIAVHDGSGRVAFMQLTVNDIKRDNRIIKRSTNLAELPVGTPVKANGSLTLRTQRAECLAIKFRISNVEWTTENRSSSTAVADISNSFSEGDSDTLFAGIADLPTVNVKEPEQQQQAEELQQSDAELQQPVDQGQTGGKAGF